MVIFNLIQAAFSAQDIKEWSIGTLLVFAILYLWRENNKKDTIIESKDERIREVINNHMADKDAHTSRIETVTKTAYDQVKEIINDLKGILEK